MDKKMMRRWIQKMVWLSPILLVAVIFGCATAPPKPTSEKDPYAQFPERYRGQAMEYEKNGDLPKALQCWEVVQAFQPADEEAGKKVAALKAQMLALADQHFKRGLSYFQSQSILAALKEFLLALYFNPDHAEALSHLKHRLTGEDFTLYEVKPGDTLKEIAKKTYQDPQRDFLIAYFNDLGKDPKLAPKSVLRLPILESPQPKPPTQTREMLMDPKEVLAEPKGTKEMMAKAVTQFKSNKFMETVSITEEILLYDPSNREARDLTNASYYQMGKGFHQGKRYQEALDSLSRVDPGYRDANELIASAKKQLAEAHYISGIKYFTEEKLDKAIQEWEETLKLNPQHPKARGDMENAARLLQKLKEIK
jgi:tetratricopeptide (TPR) repeat protein